MTEKKITNQIKLLAISVLVILVSSALVWLGVFPAESPSTSTEKRISDSVLGQSQESTSSAVTNNYVQVTKVVDGDTIEVEIAGTKYKLRYVGINTPETVDPRRPVQCFGKQASDENKRLVSGKQVRIEKDISETDKYGRLLRLVYLPLDDGTELFINDYLVREGFAQASRYPPDVTFAEQFRAAEVEAKDNNRGLWAKCN